MDPETFTPQDLTRWLTDAAARFPSVRRSWGITMVSEALIAAARRANGLPLLPGDVRKGRRACLNHADLSTCSRERNVGEVLDGPNHRRMHKHIHVTDCRWCYTRHYVYIRNHPELARPKDWWRDSNPHSAMLNGKPRDWISPGWAKNEPESKVTAEFNRILDEIMGRTPIVAPPPPPKPLSPKEMAAIHLREWRAYQKRGGKPLRLMQGTWPLTDDEDQE